MALLIVAGKTVGNRAKSLLEQSKFFNSFWVRAVDFLFYLRNRCLGFKLPPNKTLTDSRNPDLPSLKFYDCSALRFLGVVVKKFVSETVREIIAGYYLHNPATGKSSPSQNVSFNKKGFLGCRRSTSDDSGFLPEPESCLNCEDEAGFPSPLS